MLRKVEKAITATIIKTALEQGYSVGVAADGNADIKPCRDLDKILEAAFSYDCVDLILKPGSKKFSAGLIALDFFNDGKEIISNYAMGIEDFVKELNYKKVELCIIDL
jgi:hypothetical protein